MSIDKLIAIAEEQEKLLRFEHFDHSDAWHLGYIIVKKILENRLALSVSIRLFNGLTVFQYFPEGTGLNNESWLRRKYNTVREFETSTLLNTLHFTRRKWTFEGRGLDPAQYVSGGGGFPIRIKGTGVIGAVLVSGLPHLEDHGIIVESAAAHLKAGDVTQIPLDVKI
ncbi:MAG: heme-binding protein [Treponema sp.]|nr:heme-binding protein [Treponema sp.]